MKLFLKIYRFFIQRSFREQFVCCLFIWVCVVVWGMTMFRQVMHVHSTKASVHQKLQQQALWLKNADTIKSRLNVLLKSIDMNKTYSQTQLVSHVEQLIKPSQLAYSIDPPGTKKGDVWDMHTLKIHFEQAPIEKLLQIQNALLAEKPYLDIDTIRINSDDQTGATLSATMSLTALQLKKI
jgi:hypothetical protein